MRTVKSLLAVAVISSASVCVVAAQTAGNAEQPGAATNLQNLVPNADRQRAEEARDARVDAEVKDVASFVKWAKAAREEKVQSLYKRREAFRSERGNSRYKRERIDKTNEEIARINTPSLPYVPRVSTNKVITLDDLSATRYVKVLEVVDAKTARVMLVETAVGGKQFDFFLTGIDTAGWVDAQKLPLVGVLISVGSQPYTTADGDKHTIATMKLFPLPKGELTRRDDIRTWTDDAGQQVTGALVLYDAGKLTIMDMDGKTTTLKLTELSPADREYVDQHAPTPPPRKPPGRAIVPQDTN
jgi:hypothetical protein